MVSIKDKLLSSHRSNVYSSFGGHLNVFYSVLLFNFLDVCILCYFWFLFANAIKQFDCNAFLVDMIVNSVLTVTPLTTLIKSDLLFYIAFVINFFKFWHICHIVGKFSGLVAFHSLRLSRTNQSALNRYYIQRLGIYFNAMLFCLGRLVLIIVSVWYSLVLQKIRFVGGTGFEKKPASVFEEEALEEYLRDKDHTHTKDLDNAHEFTLEPIP
ncbi:putative integral membrane protein [Theileria parva strain Muguga]|uniref:Uncharacterized protein n=1 Tax=Theileria parva TaxID=5875 RepID=Q4N575_THEPA|nr:putative integral membrane protein [Theileria parva strain Muguga]EAN32698.1 putative integral membrane protein [Theileria parva strain Muguga]|eukprot:XP_764981.1 hypothetical protein [Theileria parva strain Muguga]